MINKRNRWLKRRTDTKKIQYEIIIGNTRKTLPAKQQLDQVNVFEVSPVSTNREIYYIIEQIGDLAIEIVIINPGEDNALWFRQNEQNVSSDDELEAFFDQFSNIHDDSALIDVSSLHKTLVQNAPACFDQAASKKQQKKRIRSHITPELSGSLLDKIGQTINKDYLETKMADGIYNELLLGAFNNGTMEASDRNIKQAKQAVELIQSYDPALDLSPSLNNVIDAVILKQTRDAQKIPKPVHAFEQIINQYDDLIPRLLKLLKHIADKQNKALANVFEPHLSADVEAITASSSKMIENTTIFPSTLEAYVALLNEDDQLLTTTIHDADSEQAAYFVFDHTLNQHDRSYFQTIQAAGFGQLFSCMDPDMKTTVRERIVQWDQNEKIMSGRAQSRLAALCV